MINTTYQLDDFALTLPITQEARKTAHSFANQQLSTEKAAQVRLNTLAVWVVNDYLHLMNIPTELKTSAIWNQVLRYCANVADLELPTIGRLECRPVLANQEICYVPPETWEERIGYVVVEIDDSYQEARLLGFTRSTATEELSLSELEPVEILIEHLGKLRQIVNLSQWFSGIFEAGWQSIESLWNMPEYTPACAFRGVQTLERNTVQPPNQLASRAKLIDLGLQIHQQPMMLIVELTPTINQQTNIYIQLYATGNQVHLPEGIKLTVLDESGEVFLAAQARRKDNYIQLEFRGKAREQFSIVIGLDNAKFVETFMI